MNIAAWILGFCLSITAAWIGVVALDSATAAFIISFVVNVAWMVFYWWPYHGFAPEMSIPQGLLIIPVIVGLLALAAWALGLDLGSRDAYAFMIAGGIALFSLGVPSFGRPSLRAPTEPPGGTLHEAISQEPDERV